MLKRSYPLLTVLTIPLVVALSSVAIFFSYAAYIDSKEQLKNTLTVHLEHAMNNAISNIEHETKMLYATLESHGSLPSFLEVTKEGRSNLKIRTAFGGAPETIELLFIHLFDTNRFIDLGYGEYTSFFEELTKQRSKEGVVILPGEKPLVFLLQKKKLIDPESGRVFGVLYAGIPINDNMAFMHKVKNSRREEICFLIDGIHIASTSPYYPGNWGCSEDVLETINKEGYAHFNHRIQTVSDFSIGEQNSIKILLSLPDSELVNIENRFKSRIAIIIILVLAEVVIALFFTKKLISEPLHALESYGKSLAEGKRSIYPRAFIAEFGYIAGSLNEMIGKLNSREKDLKKAEKELSRLNKELEKRIEEAVEQIRQKDLIIHEQSKQSAMDELLIDLAHHWRQPLNVCALEIQNIGDMAQECKEEEEIRENIDSAVGALISLSDTITTFTSFYESGTKERIGCKDGLALTLELSLSSFSSIGLEIQTDIDPSVDLKAEAGEWVDLFSAMLINVKDVMKEKSLGKASVAIKGFRTNGDYIITVDDDVGGIKPSLLPNGLFQPYTTTQFKSQNKGLGLYTVYGIVTHRLKGTITASNTEKGALFKIVIPCKKS